MNNTDLCDMIDNTILEYSNKEKYLIPLQQWLCENHLGVDFFCPEVTLHVSRDCRSFGMVYYGSMPDLITIMEGELEIDKRGVFYRLMDMKLVTDEDLIDGIKSIVASLIIYGFLILYMDMEVIHFSLPKLNSDGMDMFISTKIMHSIKNIELLNIFKLDNIEGVEKTCDSGKFFRPISIKNFFIRSTIYNNNLYIMEDYCHSISPCSVEKFNTFLKEKGLEEIIVDDEFNRYWDRHLRRVFYFTRDFGFGEIVLFSRLNNNLY